MALAIGQTLQQRYQIQGILGQGGMGVVYQAYDSVLQRTVAIKVLPAQLTIDAEFVQRFQREAVASANLRHPHIVTVHDVGQQDGEYFIIMEHLTGNTLEQWLAQHGPMPVAQTSQVLEQIASALDYAHSRSIVHRDVKPSNIMLDAQGRAVLMDFGLVRAGEGFGPTRSTTVMGTPEYMAPEQILGQAIDRRTDLYALGVVLHELLTGQTPFHRTTPIATAYAHVHEAPPPVRLLNKTVPQSVEAVVLKALAKDPSARYQSAGDLARDLAFAISDARAAGLVAQLPAAGSRKKPSASPAGGVKIAAMPSPASGTSPVPARPDRRKTGFHLVAMGALATMGALAALVVLIGVVLALNSRRATPSTAVVSTVSAAPVAAVNATSATLSTGTAAPEVLSDSLNPSPSVAPAPQLAATAIPLTPKLIAAQSSPTVTSTGILPTSTTIARGAAVTSTVVPAAARNDYQGAPVLLSPANGANASTDQSFSWRWDGPALRADERFEWRLQRVPSGENLAAARIVATPDVTFSMDGLPGGEYYWAVRIVQVSANGEMRTLRSPEATRRLLRWSPPTQVSPTNTPPPTDTPVPPPPTDTPVPQPTSTPRPTNTPRPTDTPVPPTDTPQPTDTPEPLPTAMLTPPISRSAMQTGDAEQELRASGIGGAAGFGVFLIMIGLNWWGQRRRIGADQK